MLTEEQRKLIEENRQRALERLSQRQALRNSPVKGHPPVGHPQPAPQPPMSSFTPADGGTVFVPFMPTNQPAVLPKPSIVQSNAAAGARAIEQTRTLPAWKFEQKSPAKAQSKAAAGRQKLTLQLESGETFTCTAGGHLDQLIRGFSGATLVQHDKKDFWSIPLSSYQQLSITIYFIRSN